MAKTVLVLGATGGVGGETARALIARGWTVRGLTRSPREGDGIDWRIGDAMDRAAVLAAADGLDAIVHAVNPPGYLDWEKLAMPMLENSIAAARANDARLALPGTIYNYDPRTSPVIAPDSAQRPNTRKGAIRVAMERAIEQSGVKAVILRAGDYFGPRPGNSWLSQGLVTPGKRVGRVMVPERAGSATPGPICPTSARLSPACSTKATSCHGSHSIYSPASGTMTARALPARSRKRSGGQSRPGGCPGRCSR